MAEVTVNAMLILNVTTKMKSSKSTEVVGVGFDATGDNIADGLIDSSGIGKGTRLDELGSEAGGSSWPRTSAFGGALEVWDDAKRVVGLM